jgi:FemAB-related protein (PEP-CTERM system-associated)
MRRHGTPVYPKLFLREILDRFPAHSNLFFVHHEGRPVAGVLNLLFGDVVMPSYAGADGDERPRGVDEYLYISIMRWGRENGFNTFDFGRSKRGTGPYDFKRNWGFEPEPLAYEFQLYRRASIPENNPLNPKYRALIALWRRLPIRVANALGPHLVKNLG